MSDAQFHNQVSDLIAAGVSIQDAIQQVAQEMTVHDG